MIPDSPRAAVGEVPPGLQSTVDPALLGGAASRVVAAVESHEGRIATLERAPRSRAGSRKLTMLGLTLGYLLSLAVLSLAGLPPTGLSDLAWAGLLALGAGVGGNAAEHMAARRK